MLECHGTCIADTGNWKDERKYEQRTTTVPINNRTLL